MYIVYIMSRLVLFSLNGCRGGSWVGGGVYIDVYASFSP